MKNCKKCLEEGKEITSSFDVVGKTYYKIVDGDDILCYRHWHQEGQPKYDVKGDYEIMMKFKKLT